MSELCIENDIITCSVWSSPKQATNKYMYGDSAHVGMQQ